MKADIEAMLETADAILADHARFLKEMRKLGNQPPSSKRGLSKQS